MLKFKILALFAIMLFSAEAYASGTPATPVKKEVIQSKEAQSGPNLEAIADSTKYQKVIDDYKTYLTTVSKEVRDEIVGFRKEMSKLNKEKHKMYKALSQEAQHYLAKERELKKKLPKDQREALLEDKDEQ